MSRQRVIQNLHQLSVRAILNAGDGDHTDGGGLLVRVRGTSTAWVFRYTAANGRRREMGLGIARRSNTVLGAPLGVSALAVGAGRDGRSGLSRRLRSRLGRGQSPENGDQGQEPADHQHRHRELRDQSPAPWRTPYPRR